MHALESYMQTFAGYGGPSAPIWFVGMEEGGGKDVAELELRVSTWNQRGASEFEDLAAYHRAIGVTHYFDGTRPKLQPTWCALIKCLQTWRGGLTDDATIRRVQATELGAHNGPASLLELLPLPSPGVNDWPYAALANTIPALATRASYAASFTPLRVRRMQGLRRAHKPLAVIFYGLGYREHWTSIAVTSLTPVTIAGHRCIEGTRDSTYFIAAPHPARANSTELWTSLGERVRAHTV